MVDYLVQHPHVATGKFQSLHGNADLRGSWEQLVSNLNKMGKDGKTKDVKSWKSTWRDYKTAVSQKIAKIRANRAATGNVACSIKLTQREEKIFGLLGFDYVEGVQCPDSFPDEEPEAMELLCEGQEEILSTVPEILSLRNNSEINSTTFTDFEILDDVEYTGEYIGSGPAVTHTLEPAERDHLHQNLESPQNQQIIKESLTEVPTIHPQTSVAQGSNPIQKTPRVAKRGRERLGTQLQHARKDFATIAERQVSCMEVFSKAMKQLADSDRERNEILRAFVAAEKAREETYSNLTAIIKDCIEVFKNKNP